MPHFFDVRSELYHYLCMARKTNTQFLQGESVKLKKYLYALRPLLACQWILERGTPPPVLFDDLKEACLRDGEIKDEINLLLARKKASPELGEGERIGALSRYIDEGVARLEEVLSDIPPQRRGSWRELNELFLSLIL